MGDAVLNIGGWYRTSFDLFEESLNGESQSILHGVRRQAMERFGATGFPTTKDEEWRFTNLAPLTRIPFAPVLERGSRVVAAEEADRFTFAGLECILMVFVDGFFSPELSRVSGAGKGVRIESLAEVLNRDGDSILTDLTRYAPFEDDAVTALNTAFLRDGAVIRVPDGTNVGLPVHIVYLSAGGSQPFLSAPRNLIRVGKNSSVSIVETYSGLQENKYLTNAVSEIILESGAVMEHDKLQQESTQGYHIGTVHVHQETGSVYVSNSISLGGSISRNTVTAVLGGERAECTLNGLALGTGRQLVDNHTVIDHVMPNCNSHELYKSVLDGESRGVFNGKIFVRKDAQKTDAKQTNKTLLLSENATIDTKPQLEIFADDVKCTHGATVGQLDEEHIFYLRSRGIGVEDAKDILTFAFASDIISRVHIDPLRDQLEGLLHSRLARGRVTLRQENAGE